MSDNKISTEMSYTVVQSLGTVVARTAHVTSSVLVDLDENGAVAGIEAIGTSVGVGELLDVIRWLRAPALSAPSEPVPDAEGICGDESPQNAEGMPRAICLLRFGHDSNWHEAESGMRWKYTHTDGPESHGRAATAEGIDPNVEAFNTIFTTVEKPPACKCEFVDIGVGYQKVAETDDCARCTPYGLASAIMVALLPHFTAERAAGWREAIEALRAHIEANYHPASIDGARLRKIAAELESLAPKETP